MNTSAKLSLKRGGACVSVVSVISTVLREPIARCLALNQEARSHVLKASTQTRTELLDLQCFFDVKAQVVGTPLEDLELKGAMSQETGLEVLATVQTHVFSSRYLYRYRSTIEKQEFFF